MANIFAKTVSYITPGDVKDSTTKTALKTMSDADVTILIYKAEKAVNNYLGYSIDISDDDTETETIIDIQMATFYTVENIYENGDLITGATVNQSSIKSESVGDHSVTYNDNTTNELEVLGIPTIAKSILDKYKLTFFNQVC